MGILTEQQYTRIRAQLRVERAAELASKPPSERIAAAAALIRKRATEAATGRTAGPWTVTGDNCDCNDGLCSHGWFATGVRFQQSVVEPTPGREEHDWDREASSEIPTPAMIWMLTIQPAAGLALADLLDVSAGSPGAVALADAVLASPGSAWDVNGVDAGLLQDQYARWNELCEAESLLDGQGES